MRSEVKQKEAVAFRAQEKRCFKCNSTKHLAHACRASKMSETTERKDLKCCVCDRSGYFVKNCRSKKQDTRSTYPPNGVCKRTNHTEKECYYKQDGRIDGNGKKEKQKICFLVEKGTQTNGYLTQVQTVT